jgi:phage shock protein PspC (stress-responsive transcriptional regulator)
MADVKKLFRSETDKVIGGVCGGIGEYFAIDPTLVRVGFVIGVIVWGATFWLYLLLWLVVPTKSTASANVGDVMNANLKEMGQRLESAFNKGASVAKEKMDEAHHATQPKPEASSAAPDAEEAKIADADKA